ncbi:DUF4845 domain-containing protein [Thermomonas sp.]|uniref:DUF4845 domain-containing protein n=1 Tax=Thermomonas sp. TaxID=1971895 RepID=UPI00321FE2DD
MKQMQRGITMIGFLITLTLVIFFAYCGMKIGPMYMEFFSVKKALAGIASDPEAANASKDKIRMLLNKRFQIDYVSVVKPEMLKIENTEGGYNLVMDYERREELFANLDVVGKFHAEQALTRGAGASNN